MTLGRGSNPENENQSPAASSTKVKKSAQSLPGTIQTILLEGIVALKTQANFKSVLFQMRHVLKVKLFARSLAGTMQTMPINEAERRNRPLFW